MSLPQTEDHTCEYCVKKVGQTCKRKRRVIEGYCTEYMPYVSVGVK